MYAGMFEIIKRIKNRPLYWLVIHLSYIVNEHDEILTLFNIYLNFYFFLNYPISNTYCEK